MRKLALASIASLASLVVMAMCSGCWGTTGTYQNGKFTDEKVNYDVTPPGAGWVEMKLPTANVAWYNEQLAASLMVNSHCDGVGDSPLEGLTSDLLMGMTEREIVSQERMAFSRREALESVATGKLDGVPRKLMLFVLKKDGCVYDIVLDAAPERFDAAKPAFVKVRDAFDVEARRDRAS